MNEIYNGPKVPNHLAPGLAEAGRNATKLWIGSELARLEREKQALLDKLEELNKMLIAN